MAKDKKERTDLQIKNVRVAFPALFEKTPKAKGSSDLTYAITLLIPKSDTKTVSLLKNVIQKTAMAAWPDSKKRKAMELQNPLKDGDAKEWEGYEDHYYIKCTSPKRKPGVVDGNLDKITDPEEIYGGCWINAHINPYAYNNMTAGIGFGILNVQKVRDDEAFGGSKAEDVFDELEDADIPESNEDEGVAAETVTKSKSKAKQTKPNEEEDFWGEDDDDIPF